MINARNHLISAILFLGISITASAQDADTAGHFGFEDIEVLPVGPSAGPVLAHDMDSDGLTDLIIANNYKSRIEIQRQRANASPEDQRAPRRVNELPEHWRFERIEIPVNVEITAITPTDLDDDGLMDLLIAGRPGSIIAYRQTSPGQYEMMRRTQVRDLTASRDGFVVADVLGTDGRDELMALAGGRIRIWQLDGGRLLPPEEINAGDATLAALFARDLDGDDLLDVIGVAPDDEAPIRVWLAAREDGKKVLGPQLRFEMPRLNEVHILQLPNENKSRIATIERTSRRLAVHELVRDGDGNANGEASLEVHGFSDPGQRTRDIVVMDLNGDSLPDVLTTDREKNSVVSWTQGEATGLAGSRNFPTYASAGVVEAGDVDGDGVAEVFTLSEEEGVVGRSSLSNGNISFPVALEIESGHVPVAMHLAELDQGPTLAVIAKDGRNHIVDLLQFDGSERQQIKLGSLSRSPNSMLAIDADQDSIKDILLFTPDKPMTMLKGGTEGEPFSMLDKDDMGQFGLVQSANNNNTQAYDIDGDGIDELLIADKNFIRAVRYDTNPSEGSSPGWQVVDQLNADREAKLVSVASLGDRIVAADREGRRLLIFERSGDGWMVTEEIGIRGLVPRSIHSGPFTGNPEGNDLLLVGDDAFAIAVMDSGRPTLVETSFWRPDDTRRVPHEIGSGDVNGDGYLDLVSLDAGEQMADILSFSGQGNLYPMTTFQVFESKIFSAGEKREYEPRQALIEDVSGDGRKDLVLLAHDRLLIYPQEEAGTN